MDDAVRERGIYQGFAVGYAVFLALLVLVSNVRSLMTPNRAPLNRPLS